MKPVLELLVDAEDEVLVAADAADPPEPVDPDPVDPVDDVEPDPPEEEPTVSPTESLTAVTVPEIGAVSVVSSTVFCAVVTASWASATATRS